MFKIAAYEAWASSPDAGQRVDLRSAAGLFSTDPLTVQIPSTVSRQSRGKEICNIALTASRWRSTSSCSGRLRARSGARGGGALSVVEAAQA